jgi:hypothetical protein
MRIAHLFYVIVGLICFGTGAASAQVGCPSEHEPGHRATVGFITSPQFAAIRRRLSFHAQPEDIRVLTMREDSAACAKLNSMIGESHYTHPPYRRSYYRAGGFYFIAFRQELKAGTPFRMGHSPLIVLDSEFKLVSIT